MTQVSLPSTCWGPRRCVNSDRICEHVLSTFGKNTVAVITRIVRPLKTATGWTSVKHALTVSYIGFSICSPVFHSGSTAILNDFSICHSLHSRRRGCLCCNISMLTCFVTSFVSPFTSFIYFTAYSFRNPDLKFPI